MENQNKKENTELSVIIVSFNCYELLRKCIESIEKYNDIGEKLEIIVVDNGSDSETENWCKQKQDLQYKKNENRGFGQANNVGNDMASGKLLLFLNPDTELTEPTFGYAIDRFKTDSKLGMLGFKLKNGQGTYTPSMMMKIHLGMLKGFINTALTRMDIFIPKYMYTSGADIFIRKDLFDKIGGFDENLFMYCEEPDITNRVNQAGYKNAYDKSKTIIHHESASAGSMAKRFPQRMKAYEYYCQKYGLDYEKLANREKRYCRLKAKIFKLMGKNEKSKAYAECWK